MQSQKQPSFFDSSSVSNSYFGLMGQALEYMADAAQRTVLFADVMRERGNQYHEHIARTVPHVLGYGAELVLDGRNARTSRQLRPGADRPTKRRPDRRDPPPVRCRRSARRTRAGHRRLQGRQRDRRRDQGRTSLLFRRLPAGPDAGADDRGHCARRSGFSGEGHRACIPRPTASPA